MNIERRPLLVIGTDTGVGKTWVARGLLRAMVRAGHRPMPLKPVETGCAVVDGVCMPADGLALAVAAGRRDEIDIIAPLRFTLAASPALAARREHDELTLARLVECVARVRGRGDRLVIESAGGLHTPITARETFADFAVAIRAEALVVARDALGTLNHTLLTLEALKRRDVPVVALVLGPVEHPDLMNREDLASFVPETRMVGPLPRIADASDDAIAEILLGAGLGVVIDAET